MEIEYEAQDVAQIDLRGAGNKYAGRRKNNPLINANSSLQSTVEIEDAQIGLRWDRLRQKVLRTLQIGENTLYYQLTLTDQLFFCQLRFAITDNLWIYF